MFNSTPDRIWLSLLFKFGSVPFVGLLLALVASQVVSLQNYSVEEPSLGNSSSFVEVTSF